MFPMLEAGAAPELTKLADSLLINMHSFYPPISYIHIMGNRIHVPE